MIGVVIIAVLFTGLAIAIAYFATRGGFAPLSRIVNTQSKAGTAALNSFLAVIYVVFMIAVPLVFIIGNHDKSNAQVGGVKLTASEQAGREIFADHCAVCHTLDADNAVGKIGPNLDQLKPSAATVMHTINNGCVQDPQPGSGTTCLGYGTMPADIVSGQQANDVANFVAAVAGHI